MAVQFIPRQEPVWGQSLSNLLGSLGNAGANIGVAAVQAKNAKQLAKQQREKEESEVMRLGQAYSQMLGFSPEQGAALARAPQKIQETMIQQIIDRGGMRGMNQQPQAPQPMMGGMRQQPQGPMDALGGLQLPQQDQVPLGGLTMSNMAQSLRPEDPNAFLAKRILGGAAAGINPSEPSTQKPLTPEKKLEREIDTAVHNYDMTHGLDMAPSNISGLLGAGMSKEEARQAVKDTAEYDKKLKEEAKAGKELTRITKDMMDLVEKDIKSGGKLLRGPATQTLLNAAEGLHGKGAFTGIGGAIGGLLGSIIPGAGTVAGAGLGAALGGVGSTLFEAYQKGTATKETQQFEKYSAEFIKGAKGIFGSRITDADLNQFMKMVPNLSNTNEGKLAILRNIQLVNEAPQVKEKVRNRIVRENGGRRPHNLEDMVEEISEPIIAGMADQFKKETERLFEQYSTQTAQPAQLVRSPQAQSMQGPRIPEYDANEL